jgi:hypothetical protein
MFAVHCDVPTMIGTWNGISIAQRSFLRSMYASGHWCQMHILSSSNLTAKLLISKIRVPRFNPDLKTGGYHVP